MLSQPIRQSDAEAYRHGEVRYTMQHLIMPPSTNRGWLLTSSLLAAAANPAYAPPKAFAHESLGTNQASISVDGVHPDNAKLGRRLAVIALELLASGTDDASGMTPLRTEHIEADTERAQSFDMTFPEQ